MDPHSVSLLDPDPHGEKQLRPNPQNMNAYPQPWKKLAVLLFNLVFFS